MERIIIDLVPGNIKPILWASQYDNGREWPCDIYNDGVPYIFQESDTVDYTIRKGDGLLVTGAVAFTPGTSNITLVSTEQMCAVYGSNLGELIVKSNGVKIGSGNFIIEVERAPDEGGLTSQSEIKNLNRQITEEVDRILPDKVEEQVSEIAPAIIQEAIGDNYYDKTEADEKFYDKEGTNTAISNAAAPLNSKVNRINGDIYGGYVPESYVDGFITNYNGKAVFNSSNDWVYIVLDVSAYVGEKLTISTYADRGRPILFTDESENVVGSTAIDTGNPNLYSTVEATVPQGATKCYIDKYKSGANDISVSGIYILKVALKSEVPTIINDFGESETAGVSQKLFTDNCSYTIEKVCPINNKLPMIDEDVPIYLDNLFRGVSPKETRLVDVNNANVHIYDKTVVVLPHNGGASARIRLHLIDDFKYERFADVTFASTTEKTASKKVLFIGDSITENLSYLNPLKTLSDNGSYNLTFLGTQGTTIKHEGRGGWAAYNYTHDASYNGKTNSFWDGSKFNFAWYISQNNIDAPDYVFINLGTNDLIRGITNPSDDEEVKSVVIPSYETMINSIHSYNANIPIVLWLPPTRCMVGRQNHTGIDNALRINKFLIEKFDKNSYINSKVYLMHTYLFVNPYTDYTISNVTINGVTYEDCAEPIHPTQSGGGEKIAKGIMRQMMYIDGL